MHDAVPAGAVVRDLWLSQIVMRWAGRRGHLFRGITPRNTTRKAETLPLKLRRLPASATSAASAA